jgi:hypothetical protein
MTVDQLVKATNGYYLSNKARSGTGVVIGRLFDSGYELTPEGSEMAVALNASDKIELVAETPVTRPRKTVKPLVE